jgi:hypothetical protein
VTRTCKWHGCGRHLITQRADADFCSDECRSRYKNWRRKQSASDTRVTDASGADVHPLTTARERQETTERDKQLGQVIHQAIVHLITTKGEAHADDLEPFYPEGAKDRCRELQPGRFGSLRSRGYIVKRGERKSRVKSRNGAKSGVYEFTKKGRERLVGTGAKDERAEGARADGERAPGLCRTASRLKSSSARSGEEPAGVSSDTGKGKPRQRSMEDGALDRPETASPHGARASLAAHPGESSQEASGAENGGVGEPRPIPLPGMEEEQRTLNPLADAEAA